MGDAGVGDDGVERAGGGFGGLDRGVHIGAVGHIDTAEFGAAAGCLDGRDGLLPLLVEHVGDVDVIAGPAEGQGRGLADADSGARDHDSRLTHEVTPVTAR